jgi:hypothetical protein
MSIPALGSLISVRETPLILIALLQPIDQIVVLGLTDLYYPINM